MKTDESYTEKPEDAAARKLEEKRVWEAIRPGVAAYGRHLVNAYDKIMWMAVVAARDAGCYDAQFPGREGDDEAKPSNRRVGDGNDF